MNTKQIIRHTAQLLSYFFVIVGIGAMTALLINSYPGGVFEPAGISLYEFGIAFLALFINVLFATMCYAVNVLLSENVKSKTLTAIKCTTKIVGILTVVASFAVAYLVGDMFWGRSMIFIRIFSGFIYIFVLSIITLGLYKQLKKKHNDK